MFEPNQELTITMTAAEWNSVMLVLHDGVYRVVAPLITKINQQCQSQMPVPNGADISVERTVQ